MITVPKWRVAVVVVFIAGMVAATVWIWQQDARAPATAPPQAEEASVADHGWDRLSGPAALAGEEAGAEAALEALRAGGDFLEFAEHTRARTAPFARLAYENFAPRVDGERVEWTNKDELWDAIAPAIRDEVLQLGPEYRQPLWDNRNAVPNAVSMAWSNEDTGGRGDYVEFKATYTVGSDARRRYWGFLIATGSEGGFVMGRMEPFDLRESDYSHTVEAHEAVVARTWAWIQSRPEAQS